MRARLIVMLDPYANLLSGLKPGFKGIQIHTFIFQAPPEPLYKDIVHPSSFAVHRDFYPVFFEHTRKIKTRKLAPLIGIENPRYAV